MDAIEKPSDVAERLRALQAKLGLTIQQMADRCGLPKRSLENYMNLRSPQRPGLDALAGIADGFNVSIDWLVGRSALKDTGEFTKEDYAFFCQSTVLRVLIAVVDAVKEDPHNAIDPEHYRIMGHELHDIGSVAQIGC